MHLQTKDIINRCCRPSSGKRKSFFRSFQNHASQSRCLRIEISKNLAQTSVKQTLSLSLRSAKCATYLVQFSPFFFFLLDSANLITRQWVTPLRNIHSCRHGCAKVRMRTRGWSLNRSVHTVPINARRELSCPLILARPLPPPRPPLRRVGPRPSTLGGPLPLLSLLLVALRIRPDWRRARRRLRDLVLPAEYSTVDQFRGGSNRAYQPNGAHDTPPGGPPAYVLQGATTSRMRPRCRERNTGSTQGDQTIPSAR